MNNDYRINAVEVHDDLIAIFVPKEDSTNFYMFLVRNGVDCNAPEQFTVKPVKDTQRQVFYEHVVDVIAARGKYKDFDTWLGDWKHAEKKK
jgi:hypothetical protein